MIDQSMLKNMMIPSAIISVLKLIEHHGFEAFIVGGAIRDTLFGQIPREFDLATSASPTQISKWFSVVSDAGKKFGSITIRYDHHIIEITTYRQESQYSDSRHPNVVALSSSIVEDLSRRDFTINAMAYSPITNQFIDNFGGLEHLNQCRLVCVGKPLDRFKDDMLRPFRCFRFMAQFGLVVSSSICQALSDLSTQLVLPSISRIRHEMDRMLMGRYWQSASNFMQQMGWWEPVIPKVPEPIRGVVPSDRLFRWAWALSATSIEECGKRLQFSKSDRRWMQHILDWKFDEAAIHFGATDLCVDSKALMQMGFKGPALGRVQSELVQLIRQKKINHTQADILAYLNHRHLI